MFLDSANRRTRSDHGDAFAGVDEPDGNGVVEKDGALVDDQDCYGGGRWC